METVSPIRLPGKRIGGNLSVPIYIKKHPRNVKTFFECFCCHEAVIAFWSRGKKPPLRSSVLCFPLESIKTVPEIKLQTL